MKKYIIASVLIVLSFNLFSQIAGNQVYKKNNQNYNRNPTQNRSFLSTDSTLIINAKVLLNKKADYYSISIGVSQEDKTVIECLNKINTRISSVKRGFNKIGVKNENIDVDFISETKIYDHTIEGKLITEYLVGYEIKKNITLKTNDLSTIEKIINICSKEKIFDIIKVDYVNKDVEAINTFLFEQAISIIKSKKERFIKNSSIKLTGKYRIVSENFKIYYPKNLYKQYDEAYESSTVNSHYSSYTRKNIRKSSTYYYDGIEFEISVDKIIDEVSPKVGIQYMMEIQMIYELEK